MQPLVSIILCNYNYEEFVGRAIDSALNQTYPKVEVVVVDDGSTDSSREVIRSYGERITAIYKENGGHASALNLGFAAAQGDIIIFLDTDDYLIPKTVKKVVETFECAPDDVVHVYYRLELVNRDNAPIGSIIPSEYPGPHDATIDLAQGLRYSPPPTSGNAFRRSTLEGFFPIPSEEYRYNPDSFIRLSAAFRGRVVSIPLMLGKYAVHGRNKWAPGDNCLTAEREKRIITAELKEERLLQRLATEAGKTVPPLRQDRHHLRRLLTVYKLDKSQYPFPDDHEVKLAWQGSRAVINSSKHGWAKKASICGWFWSVALLPKPLAKKLLEVTFPGYQIS